MDPQWNYDVFLSFRGEDTRKSFTSHLSDALTRNGFKTFIDDKRLERGSVIAPELLRAIQESRLSVVVLSKTYAASSWCLNELAEILECKKRKGQEIMPVFYDVYPSDVRSQKGHFEEAFLKHEQRYKENVKIIQTWRSALTEVGNISGWDVKCYRSEADIIREIVQIISIKLSPTYSCVVDGLIGIDERFVALNSLLNIGSNDILMIGISGMGGIGKTTLARVVYDLVPCDHFEGKSFLANVRDVSGKGQLESLQKQLLSEIFKEELSSLWNAQNGVSLIRNRLRNKKVLIVVDDVDHLDQLEYLVGARNWFGPGSRIIITSRDEHVLRAHGVRFDAIYRPMTLNDDEALRLFSLKAFKNDQPRQDFIELCKSVVAYAGGLPLALKVFGSFLCGRNIKEWSSAIKRLKEDSGKGILDRLQISFDGLEENEHNIFLDIACFFRGMDQDDLKEIMDGCDFHSDIGLRILIDRSLVTIKENKVCMHDLLQEMGQKIVWQESPKEPGKRSRLWDEADICNVLTQNTGTMAVEAMMLEHKYLRRAEIVQLLNAETFLNMKRLRILKVRNLVLSMNNLSHLSSDLRVLEWHGYNLKSLPASFEPDKLVALDMRFSCLEKLWEGVKLMPKLKSINVSHSENLTKTPDLTCASNLEILNLEGCVRLSEIHPSIGVLERLKSLNLKDCKSLKRLPSSLNGLKSLKALNLSGCHKIKELPEKLGEVKCLEELDLSRTAIRRPPTNIFLLPNLKALSFHGCKCQPTRIRNFLFLSRLLARKNPDSLILSLPTFTGLCSLTKLDLSDCNLDEASIPNDIGGLSSLTRLNLSYNNFANLPLSIGKLLKLDSLDLKNCKMLQTLTPLSNLNSLRYLNLSDCDLSDGVIPDNIGCLSSLIKLNLSHNNFINLPESINQLSELSSLDLGNCKMLQSLPEVSPTTRLYADGCLSLETFSATSIRDLKHVSYHQFYFWGSLKSKANEKGALMILKRFFEGAEHNITGVLDAAFHYVVPARNVCEMQEWFKDQSEGDSITIKVPRDLQSDSECMGFVLSVAFELHERQPGETRIFTCMVDERIQECGLGFIVIPDNKFSGDPARCHQWICYLPKDNYRLQNHLRENHFCFHVITDGPGWEIKKSGIRVLYRKDVQEMIRQAESENLCGQDVSEELKEDVSLKKRNRDDCDGLQAKRFKMLE